ncbi:hypothetical protein SVIOM74S_09993 [Streptomyces violarus]
MARFCGVGRRPPRPVHSARDLPASRRPSSARGPGPGTVPTPAASGSRRRTAGRRRTSRRRPARARCPAGSGPRAGAARAATRTVAGVALGPVPRGDARDSCGVQIEVGGNVLTPGRRRPRPGPVLSRGPGAAGRVCRPAGARTACPAGKPRPTGRRGSKPAPARTTVGRSRCLGARLGRALTRLHGIVRARHTGSVVGGPDRGITNWPAPDALRPPTAGPRRHDLPPGTTPSRRALVQFLWRAQSFADAPMPSVD